MRVSYLSYVAVTALLVIAAGAAALARQSETPTAPLELTYTCPMHPQIVQAKPGVCPLCRMALKPTKAVAAQKTERATDGQTPLHQHHEGMSMRAHDDMDATQMEHGNMGNSMCGCGMCMMMGMGSTETTSMEAMNHGSGTASATTKPASQRSHSGARSGSRGCGC